MDTEANGPMRHQFFGTSKYPSHLPLAKKLHQTLYESFRSPTQVDMLYRGCGKSLPPLNLGLAPHELWMHVLDNLSRSGVLSKLCADLLILDPLHPEIRATIQSVMDATDTFCPLAPQTLVHDDESVPVLDRESLRVKLKLLGDDNHPMKVLVVRGDINNGKSHCRHLFESAARAWGSISIYLCGECIATVDDVFTEVFTGLGASESDIPPAGKSEQAWYRAVCRKMLALATQKNISLWIAVDDLGVSGNAPLLDRRILDFCELCAMFTVNPSFRKRFRLMLIDYPRDKKIPTMWKREIWEEEIVSEADIFPYHVTEAIKFRAQRENKTLLERDLMEATDKVMAAAKEPQGADDTRPYLRRLYEELDRLLKSL